MIAGLYCIYANECFDLIVFPAPSASSMDCCEAPALLYAGIHGCALAARKCLRTTTWLVGSNAAMSAQVEVEVDAHIGCGTREAVADGRHTVLFTCAIVRFRLYIIASCGGAM
jgi:hypothetical protein